MAEVFDGIKERLLIQDETLDTEAEAAYDEALLYVEKAINKYDPDFVSTSIEIGDFLWGVASDLGAGIFKRRHMPEDMDSGWWAQGLKKLETHISTTYLPMQIGTLHFAGMDDD